MDIRDYSRPRHDNGRGMHWSAGNALAVGLPKIKEVWIPELQAMNVRWVKLLHDGALPIAEELLKHGIMPVVRLYRPRPNPGRLDGKLVEALRALAASGVRYFETNNEPNLGDEWLGGEAPENAPRLVAENWLFDAEQVYNVGGYCAVPAPSVGASGWDLVGQIVALGHSDLLEQGAWIAVHNYSLNHPLIYPDDPVNRQGSPLSSADYAALDGWAWDNEALEQINSRRLAGANPERGLDADHSCFREFEHYDALCRLHLGHSLPVISTEAGPLVGSREDPRYPRLTPHLHAEHSAEICDYMQSKAPAYYFACCLWLLANYEMGSSAAAWEGQSWYTHWWDRQFGLQGRLPAVAALKAMTSQPRQPDAEPRNSALSGRVPELGAGETLHLRGAGVQARSVTGDEGTFVFAGLGKGRYAIARGDTVLKEGIEVDGTNSIRLDNLKLPPKTYPGVQWDTRLDALRVSIEVAGLPAGSTYWRIVRVVYEPAARGRSAAYCEVQDEQGQRLLGQKLTLSWPSGSGSTATENKPAPEYAANFPLGGSYNPDDSPGPYAVGVDGLPSDKISGLGRPKGNDANFYITWQRSLAQAGVGASTIRGIVIGGKLGLAVTLRSAAGATVQTTLDGSGSYAFGGLPAGVYTLEVGGASLPNLQVDGTNTVDATPIDLRPQQSSIKGTVTNAAGAPVARAQVTLTSGSVRQQQETDGKGAYQFTGLAAGTYTVEVAGTVQTASVDGRNQATVDIRLPSPEQGKDKLIGQYLLFGPPQQVGTRANLLLAEDYILKFTPTVGFAVDEALQAQSVIIVGDVQAISAAAEEKLKAAGCQVSRLGGGAYAIEQAFARLVKGQGASVVPFERLGGPAVEE